MIGVFMLMLSIFFTPPAWTASKRFTIQKNRPCQFFAVWVVMFLCECCRSNFFGPAMILCVDAMICWEFPPLSMSEKDRWQRSSPMSAPYVVCCANYRAWQPAIPVEFIFVVVLQCLVPYLRAPYLHKCAGEDFASVKPQQRRLVR